MARDKEDPNVFFDEDGKYARLSLVTTLSDIGVHLDDIRFHLESIETLLFEVETNSSEKNLGTDFDYMISRIKMIKTSRTKLDKYVSDTNSFIARILDYEID